MKNSTVSVLDLVALCRFEPTGDEGLSRLEAIIEKGQAGPVLTVRWPDLNRCDTKERTGIRHGTR